MEEFRSSLDALGAQSGQDYLLTGFAPAGGWNAGQGGWLDPRLFAVVDFLNVQGYDFHGGWVPDKTGHQGNLHPDGAENWGLGLDGAMSMYVKAGADPLQLNAGLAAYGHGWYGVADGSAGWKPAAGYIGTKTYAEPADGRHRVLRPEDRRLVALRRRPVVELRRQGVREREGRVVGGPGLRRCHVVGPHG